MRFPRSIPIPVSVTELGVGISLLSFEAGLRSTETATQFSGKEQLISLIGMVCTFDALGRIIGPQKEYVFYPPELPEQSNSRRFNILEIVDTDDRNIKETNKE